MATSAPTLEEPKPLSMAPGLGTIGGAPTDADSAAKPADPVEDPRVTAVTEKTKPEDPRVSVPEPPQDKNPPAEDPRVEAVPEPPPPVQPQLQTAPEAPKEGYGASAAVTADKADQASQISHLIDQGHSPGEAQAMVTGQPPITLAGKAPAPKPSPTPVETAPPPDKTATAGDDEGDDTTTPAKPEVTAPAAPTKPSQPTTQGKPLFDPVDWKALGYKSFAEYAQFVQSLPAGTHAVQGPGTTAQLYEDEPGSSSAPAAPSTSTTTTTPPASADEKPTVIGGNKIYGTATSFGRNYDGSIDLDDNGRGFFGNVDTRNPKLKAVAVPVDVLETLFGKFTQKNAQGGYDALQTPEAKKIIQQIQSAHVEALDVNGKSHNFPIVDIQGSLKGHKGKVLDMTPAAGRELGFNDNHAVSYQIIGGDGKPFQIPANQLAGWNSDDAGSSGEKGGSSTTPGGGPGGEIGFMPMIPTMGPSGSARPSGGAVQPPASSGGGGPSSQGGGQSGIGSLGLELGALAAGAALGRSRGGGDSGNQAQQPPPETEPEDPFIAAMMKRGFTRQEATNFAQSTQNVAPGKGVGPFQRPPAPPAPGQVPPPVTPKLMSAKQLMPTMKVPKIGPQQAPPPPAPGAPRQLPAPPPKQQAPPTPPPGRQTPPPPPPKPPSDLPPPPPPEERPQPRPRQIAQGEPSEFGRPPGSTHGDPNPPGMEELTSNLQQMAKQHAGLLSDDDPRVKKQADGKIKGEHFVPGDQFHTQLLSGLPEGQSGRQRSILAEAEEAIAEKRPMHVSYLSAPKEAEKFPTRDSRMFQYDEHSPQARLMGSTTGQLVGHSFIPVSIGVTPSSKKGEPHEGVIHGISTNVLANNFQHLNDKLAAMGRESPYKTMGQKFTNDLEGYFSNLNAGHTATGKGYHLGTSDHPNEPDREHVPYKLTRKEADFINATINNTGAFSKHRDAQKLRELARANGTLITEKGETNRMLHDIEQQDPGWSGRGSGKQGRVLEPSIRSFKTGLIMAHHRSEEHLGEAIRPGKEYQALSKAIQRTSERGRPDVPIATSLHHTFADHKAINNIERDFSEHRIGEAEARAKLKDMGEDPDDYRFVGGSGGLITPYEDDPEALTPEEHSQMKDNLRQQWIGGKMNVEDYRRKAAEVPLPQKPSRTLSTSQQSPSPDEPEETPETPAPAAAVTPKPPKPKPVPKAPPEPAAQPDEAPEEPVAPPAVPPGPAEPLPKVTKKAAKAKEPAPAAPVTAGTAPEKPSWKTANEKARQAYLKERVAHDLSKQYKGEDAHQLEVDRDEKGGVKYDPAGNPIYKKVDYDIANSPLLKKKGLKQIKDADKHEDTLGNLIGPDGKEVIDPETGKPQLKHSHLNQTERRRLSAMHTASAVHTMGNKIVDEFMKIKDQPEIMAGEGWYSRMREKLAAALGEHHELFAQLLGATSAKTPVRNNFIQSLDALEQYKNGNFKNHIEKYLEAHEKMKEGKGALVAHMQKLGIPLYDKDGNTVDTHDTDAAAMANWVHHHGILPRQQLQPGQLEGSKYNANSMSVLRALAGTWLKEVDAPKTPNFAGNLTGRTLEATIDVWAARFLKRLGYEGHGKGPWRAQGKSEPGVNSLDFAFSQDAMRHAADEITRRTGKKMNPDDLQAIAWFAEKHHWEKRGWTRGAGAEKSSFDDVADLAFPKTGESMTSADLRKHYGALQAEAKRVKARVKTAKTYVNNPNPKMAAKLAPYMEQHGLTHEQVHGPEVEEEDEDEAA